MSDIEELLKRLDEGYNGAMYTTLTAATIRQLQADNAASKNREDALKLRNEELKTEQEFFKSKEIASYNQAIEDAVNWHGKELLDCQDLLDRGNANTDGVKVITIESRFHSNSIVAIRQLKRPTP